MIPKPAQYLLRFDDLCPTLSRSGWELFQSLLEEFRIQPILAVVPENRDQELSIDAPDPNFWFMMQWLQKAGATIGLHGYQHICESQHGGMLRLHRSNEFPGVPEDMQRTWINKGMGVLRSHGLEPKIFVAPRHGFDRATLRAIKAEGIEYVSDGFARVPFSRFGVRWIPQQLWSPVAKETGLWTICIHVNNAGDWLAGRLRSFLEVHADQFTSFDRVVKEHPMTSLGPYERIYEVYALNRVRISRLKKQHARERGLTDG